jgi:hypothetical protein
MNWKSFQSKVICTYLPSQISVRQNQNWERSDQPKSQLAQTRRKCVHVGRLLRLSLWLVAALPVLNLSSQ